MFTTSVTALLPLVSLILSCSLTNASPTPTALVTNPAYKPSMGGPPSKAQQKAEAKQASAAAKAAARADNSATRAGVKAANSHRGENVVSHTAMEHQKHLSGSSFTGPKDVMVGSSLAGRQGSWGPEGSPFKIRSASY